MSGPETLELPPDELIGQVIDGRYRITGVLGTGGMGSVYRAEHLVIKRSVALKLLHPAAGQSPDMVRRFEREAMATGRIVHPNCVTVSDAGRLPDGTLFLVLELLDGETLFDVLDRETRLHPASAGGLPPERACRIMRHVLRGLGQVHASGIVHRDVKPENVILVKQEEDPDFAKLLDFGIAKLIDDAQQVAAAGLTQTGMVIGTPAYMSPEQAFGQPVDVRTDVYSASVLFFEMLTGRQPFVSEEDVLQVLVMHASADIPRFADVAPSVTVAPAIEQLVRDGMAKDKAARIPNVEEYLRRLDACAGRAATTAQVTMEPLVRRHRGRLAAAAGVVALVGLIVLAVVSGQRSSKSPAFGGLVSPVAASGPKSAHAREAERLLSEGNPAAAVAYLEGHAKAIEGDVSALLVLGHSHAALRQHDQALRAYHAAARKDRAALSDRTLRINLGLMLGEDSDAVATRAIELLELAATRLEDPGARTHLVELASSHPQPATRQRARDVVVRLGLGDRIDRLQAYSLDLEQGKSCEDRREAVARLRALGDKRAIPELAKARSRVRRGGFLRLEKRNANHCLKKDADEAIQYLESL